METMTNTENTLAAAQNDLISSAARDIVKKAAEAAKERTMTFQAGAEKATTAVEQKLATAVGEVAKLTRQAQQAAYEDAQAFFSGVDQLASAKCAGEAVRIYLDYVRGRSDVAIARASTASDLLGKLVTSGAKTVQQMVVNYGLFNKAA
jgi:hypothetical protein